VVLGDFNEDGAPDIAVGHNNVATFSIVNSNGLGGFLPAVGITTAQTGTRVWPPAGDLNADTHVDLLVSDGVSPNRRITRFLGTGTGAFGPQLDLAVGTNVLAGTLADINGDGRLDVVSNDGNTGTASVQLGDGTGGAGAPVRFSMEVLTPPITLDVNRDGRMDVAVGAPDSDIGIFLNTCGQPPANLSVDISDAPDPVANGALVTYTIDVANAGPDAATDVLVAQVVPSGFDFVSAVSSQGSCTFFHLGAQFITGTVGCPLGTLPSGGSASITVTARAVAGGTRTSSVTVTSNQFDPSSADNSAFETTTVNAGAVTLTVVNTDNSGPGSLRQAIIDANLNFGQRDTIAFNISGGGTQTITLSTALPNLTDPVIIDGTTQPGYNGTPLIELNGNGLPAAGLNLGSPASDSTIRGLAINRFGGAGIFISSASSGNTILGNFIGTDVTGTIAHPNGSGIQLGGFGNQIGGQTAGLRNLVSGNSGPGVLVTGANALNNVIQGSYIGTAANGLTPLPNGQSGIVISNGASSNTIGGLAAGAGNVISGNTVRGIEASSGTENRISGNSVFNNGALGIDLGTIGVTPNDTGDGDTGANNLQNFPVVTSATTSAGLTTVIGTLNSTAQTQYTLEFFTNATCDGSGNGEGQTFVGLTTVTTNADGNASFQTTVSASTIVTATATDPSGNTSEFSACVTAGGPSANLRVATTDAPDPVTLNGELVYTVTVTNDGPSPATGVSLTQTLGAGVTFLSSSPMACDVTAQGALCPIGSLASGASSVVTIRARATAAGIHSSTSTVQANEPDPNAANNTAAATTMVIAYGPCQAGTFGPPAIYPAGRNTEIVALGDFNEDGIVDVVASNDTGNPRGIQLLIGNGDGTFDPPVYFQAGADGMSVGDFDRDGNLDVVTANENDQVTILYGNGAGGFPRVTRFPTGLEDAGGAFSADLTGDGFLDVVLGIEDEGGVAYLMRNDGAGGLLAPVALPSGTELGGIDLEDFNGDGFIDIATANGGDSTISILRNNGTGVFTEVSRLPVDTLLGIRPVGDLNGDGRPDIGLGREVTGDLAISVYFNSASGAFTGPIDIIQTSVDIHDVTAADVTGDGFRDLVMFGSIVQVLRNDGTGNFGPPAVYAISTDPGNLTIGDVNGDGRPDILVGLENAGVGVLLNRCGTQTGSANLAVTMTDSADPVTTGSEFTYTITVTNLGPDVATGVIVNDALPAPDVVFAGMVTGTCTFVGDDAMTCPIGTLPVNGTATITFRVRGYNGVRTNAATAIADQADPDFSNNAASQTTVITPIFGPCGEDTFNGTFASPTTFAAGLNTYMSALGDFNEDGIVDVVVTDASTTGRVAVLRGNGNGTFQAAVFVSVGANPNGIVVADFDEDGNLDFATANQVGNSVSIAYGDGTGGFPTVSTIPVGAINPIGIATADVTGDGNLDLVIGAQAAGSVARLLVGVPVNRDFTPQIALPSGQMPREVVLDDYDGDGDIDIVTGNGANATISVLTNNGTGTFTQTTVLSTGANPRVRRTGDLNSDGRPDIMYVSAAPVTGNAVFVYLSTPAGGFTGPTEVIPANFGAFHGAVADLNGDGFLDIANVTGGNMSVFAGHGDGGFHFTGSYTHGPASNTLTIGDVNGDARPDILVARAGSGVVSLFLSRCGAQTGEAELSVVKTDSADPVAVNSQFTYTIAVTNNGPDVATNVIVTDSLPTPNIQFLGMVTGTCTFVAGSLTCPIGTIQVGQTASITMNVRAVNGTRFNLATAIGDQVDPNFFNNTAFQQTTITPGAGTFVVTNTADSGQGSLRQAIIDANANTGQRDTIIFNIGAGGAQTITLASALPTITDSIFINGASQANPNGTPFIELNGNGVALNGFVLTTGSALSTIRGLAINRFTGAGISINNAASTGNTIEGNFIGTDQTG
ncbi:MAG TPA: FG-GAP-like repeat-containing protein, partial [Vicinamibacterales bacterium]|nr:FG-GAP-like repeat-containing protein [Vicinamibacterales bacterium]